jgi:hypothetical protein
MSAATTTTTKQRQYLSTYEIRDPLLVVAVFSASDPVNCFLWRKLVILLKPRKPKKNKNKNLRPKQHVRGNFLGNFQKKSPYFQ